jgi:hypothetical protein
MAQADVTGGLIEEPERFAVVEKFGLARDVAAHFDPRSARRTRARNSEPQ